MTELCEGDGKTRGQVLTTERAAADLARAMYTRMIIIGRNEAWPGKLTPVRRGGGWRSEGARARETKPLAPENGLIKGNAGLRGTLIRNWGRFRGAPWPVLR